MEILILIGIIIVIYIITLKKVENYSTLRDPKEYGNYGYYDYNRLWNFPDRELYDHRFFGGYENVSNLHKNYISGYYQPWM